LAPFSPSKGDPDVIINCLDPCFCKTSLGHSGISTFERVAGVIFSGLFARTSEEGARTLVLAASAGKETNGKYMRAGVLKDFAPMVLSEDGAKKEAYAWDQLKSKLETIVPGILNVVQ
jgi:retinol dehydrogenase-12